VPWVFVFQEIPACISSLDALQLQQFCRFDCLAFQFLLGGFLGLTRAKQWEEFLLAAEYRPVVVARDDPAQPYPNALLKSSRAIPLRNGSFDFYAHCLDSAG